MTVPKQTTRGAYSHRLTMYKYDSLDGDDHCPENTALASHLISYLGVIYSRDETLRNPRRCRRSYGCGCAL